MPKWTQVFIELYTEEGYRGRWESSPGPASRGWDIDDLPGLARCVREELGFTAATLQYCEDGETLVIGVFDGVEPPGEPKRGRVIIPDVFEDHL